MGTWMGPMGTWCIDSKRWPRSRAWAAASAWARPMARTAPAATPNPPPSLTGGPLGDGAADPAAGEHVDGHEDDERAEQAGEDGHALLAVGGAVLAGGLGGGRGCGAVGAGGGLLGGGLAHAGHRTPGPGQGVRAQRQFSFDPPPAPRTLGPTFRRSAGSVRSVTRPRCPWPGAAILRAWQRKSAR